MRRNSVLIWDEQHEECERGHGNSQDVAVS